MKFGCTIVLVVLASGPVSAGGVLDRYAKDGCVIGPDATRPAQAQLALQNGWAVEQGDWLVLGAESCTMVPPQIEPEISAADREVFENITAINRAEEPQYQGCFVDPVGVQSALQFTRGWSAERAFSEYFAMVAAGIVSGEWRFFSDSPLRTPTSVQYVGGNCAQVPYAAQLAQSHDELIGSYDGFVRANARYVACEAGETIMSFKWTEAYQSLGEGLPVNAWHPFELQLMALGAGMIEGASLREKGTLRPPFCVHDGLITQ